MIHFSNVCKKYSTGYEALRYVNLDIAKNEMVFLTGHSGAGKTTLLKLIVCMEKASRGQVEVNGHNLEKIKRRQLPDLRRSIGVIFQDPQLLPERTIFDNVALPLTISGANETEKAKHVRAALDLVGLLGKEKRYPLSLSAGEQQRVGIARAIINRPKLIIADEPTGNLDPDLSLDIMKLFERLNQAGATVLIASHDLSLIASLPHRVLTLKEGELVNDVKN